MVYEVRKTSGAVDLLARGHDGLRERPWTTGEHADFWNLDKKFLCKVKSFMNLLLIVQLNELNVWEWQLSVENENVTLTFLRFRTQMVKNGNIIKTLPFVCPFVRVPPGCKLDY